MSNYFEIKQDHINYKNNDWGWQSSNGYDQCCLHNTVNSASAASEVEYIKSRVGTAFPTYHIVVDEKEAIQIMPFEVDAWAVSDGTGRGGNTTDIHIEIARSTSDGDLYAKAFANAMKVIAQIFSDLNWSISASKISFHYDYNTKYCPHNSLNEFGGDGYIGSTKSEEAANKLRKHIVANVKTILEGDEDMAKRIDKDYKNAIIFDNGVEYGGKYAIEPTEAKMIRRVDPKTGKMKDTGNNVVIGRRYTTDFWNKIKGSDGIVRNYHYLVPKSATNTNIDVVQVDFYKAE